MPAVIAELEPLPCQPNSSLSSFFYRAVIRDYFPWSLSFFASEEWGKRRGKTNSKFYSSSLYELRSRRCLLFNARSCCTTPPCTQRIKKGIGPGLTVASSQRYLCVVTNQPALNQRWYLKNEHWVRLSKRGRQWGKKKKDPQRFQNSSLNKSYLQLPPRLWHEMLNIIAWLFYA